MSASWQTAVVGFAAFAVLGLVAGFVTGGASDSAVEQPIAFNHRLHVVVNEIECGTCHAHFTEQTFSGLPENDVCASCHVEPLGDSAAEAKLVRLLASGKALEWNLLFEQPPHVFYSHRRHVGVANLECALCHGDIGESEAPPRRVQRLSMDDCMKCHEAQGASTHCTACHR